MDWGFIGDLVDAGSEVVNGIVDTGRQWVEDAGQVMQDTFTTVTDAAGNVYQMVVDAGGNAIRYVIKGITWTKSQLEDGVRSIQQLTTGAITALVNGLRSIPAAVISAIGSIASAILSGFKGLLGGFST